MNEVKKAVRGDFGKVNRNKIMLALGDREEIFFSLYRGNSLKCFILVSKQSILCF